MKVGDHFALCISRRIGHEELTPLVVNYLRRLTYLDYLLRKNAYDPIAVRIAFEASQELDGFLTSREAMILTRCVVRFLNFLEQRRRRRRRRNPSDATLFYSFLNEV